MDQETTMKPRRHPDPNGLVHALLYTRVSGAEHQKMGLSLEVQEKMTRTYAAMQAGWIIAGEFQDVMTGRRDDRPEYQAMLAESRALAARGNRIAVVVMRSDRLGRDVPEASRARKELTQLGAAIHLIAEGGHVADLPAHIYIAVAQEESKKIGERVSDVRRNLVLNGWFYGRTPFGYRTRPLTELEQTLRAPLARQKSDRWVASLIEPDPLTRDVLVDLVNRVADGGSVYSVARWLASQPSPLRGGRAWGLQSVIEMLRSPTYVARPAEGSEDVLSRPIARWVPLVTDELWSRVQHRLEATHKRRGRYPSGRYLLTGYLRCARCGSRMGVTARGDGHRIYRCIGASLGANAPLAGCQYGLPLRIADRKVLDAVNDTLQPLADPKRWPTLLAAWGREQSGPNQRRDTRAQKLADIERKLATSRKRLADAGRVLIDSSDRLVYEALRDEELQTMQALEAEKARLGDEQSVRAPKLPPLDQVLRQAGSWAQMLASADVADQRAVLEPLVTSVRLNRLGYAKYHAEITWSPLGQALRALLDPVVAEEVESAA
jgi:DNA invertase Pin-like site-specific DNA recombinase